MNENRFPLFRPYDGIYIHYDPDTGKTNVPENMNGKYLAFKHNNKHIKVHVFAFYYMTGEWPDKLIDHIDEDKVNNKWNNLRKFTNGLNQLRSSTKRRSNTSGYIGVSQHSQNKNWLWHLQIDYKPIRVYGINCPTVAAIKRDRYIITNNIEHAYLNVLKR